MPRIVIGGLTVLLCLVPAGSGRTQSSMQVRPAQTVVALYGFEQHTPTVAIIDRVLHRELVSRPSTPAQLHSEFMDVARFDGPAHEAGFAAFLRERYGGRQVDLLLSPDPISLRFLLKHETCCSHACPSSFSMSVRRRLRSLLCRTTSLGLRSTSAPSRPFGSRLTSAPTPAPS
jgi:hypothetical protein